MGHNGGRESKRCSVIVTAYNRLPLTVRCLHALAKNTPDELYEAVIVDNGSSDGTGEWVSSMVEGDVKFLSLPRNIGFAAACHEGTRVATGEYLVFLSNDTEPQPGWLDALVELAESDNRIGVVGAKLIHPNGRLQEAGGIIFNDGYGWNYGRGDDPDDPQYNYVREVDYCSGACLLVKRHVWDTIGGFDLRYSPAYYEDTDLCFAARQAGYKVMYQPAARVIHVEGGTCGTDPVGGFKAFQTVNHHKFLTKWQQDLVEQYPNGPTRVKEACFRCSGLNVLVIDPFLPMYDRAAGSRRLFHVLRLLREYGHRVTFVARNALVDDWRQVPYVKELWRMGIEVWANDRARLRPLGIDRQAAVNSWSLEDLLQSLPYDLAIISFWEVAEQYLPMIRRFSPHTRIAVDTVDVHFIREHRQALITGDAADAARAENTQVRELAVYAQADGIITVTETDGAGLRKHLPNKPIWVIPTVHEGRIRVCSFHERRDLLFIGNFNHQPNVDAVLFFITRVFPLIRRERPDIRLHVVGNAPPPRILRFNGEAVNVTGYVPDPDLDSYLNRCRVSVAPLRFGAGMKGKIGEALGAGLPVVTTHIGAEGMDLVNGVHALLADEPEDFAAAVLQLYNDQALWETISREGRKLVLEKWSPAVVGRRIHRLLSDAMLTNRPANSERVSIVIPVFNQLEYTKLCVESVFKNTRPTFELILVNNGSTDGTASYLDKLRAERRNVKVLHNRINTGFPAACNQGMAAATGQFIVLLNNDTVVTEGWLESLLRAAEPEDVGLVGPLTNHARGSQQLLYMPYNNLDTLNRFARALTFQNRGRRREASLVIFFCTLIKRCVLETIGGLDTDFGLGNFEDDDFCLRARRAGFKIVITEDAFVHHFGSRTFAGANMDYRYLIGTAWQKFKEKWGLPADLTLNAWFAGEVPDDALLPSSRLNYVPLAWNQGQPEMVAFCSPIGGRSV